MKRLEEKFGMEQELLELHSFVFIMKHCVKRSDVGGLTRSFMANGFLSDFVYRSYR